MDKAEAKKLFVDDGTKDPKWKTDNWPATAWELTQAFVDLSRERIEDGQKPLPVYRLIKAFQTQLDIDLTHYLAKRFLRKEFAYES